MFEGIVMVYLVIVIFLFLAVAVANYRQTKQYQNWDSPIVTVSMLGVVHFKNNIRMPYSFEMVGIGPLRSNYDRVSAQEDLDMKMFTFEQNIHAEGLFVEGVQYTADQIDRVDWVSRK